jgi:alanine-synthesizing transaminase
MPSSPSATSAIPVAGRVNSFTYAIRNIVAEARKVEAAGRPVRYLNIGDPIAAGFETPPHLVEAVSRAMRHGQNGYTPSPGIPEAREAVADDFSARGFPVDPDRVLLTTGTSEGIELTLNALVDPGDEVLVPDPGYPGYRHFVRAFEGVPRPLALAAQSDFQPTLDSVRRAWRPRTKGLLLGSPSNPTGTVADAAELARIAQFVDERGGVLIADEIYQGLV